MRQPIRSSTVKRLIVVLAILLALSLAALCAVRYYGRQAGRAAEAPGNGIQTVVLAILAGMTLAGCCAAYGIRAKRSKSDPESGDGSEE